MTRLRGASVTSPDASRSSAAIDSQPRFSRSKLPPNAPDVISQNTIVVSDPAQVLPWCRDDRRRQFNLLVRRYKNQVLYGCQNPGCCTPTCASYRRRTAEGPFRRYTELSARTLACYLASLDNAEDGLCRNRPIVHSEFKPQGCSRRASRRNAPSQDAEERDRTSDSHTNGVRRRSDHASPEKKSSSRTPGGPSTDGSSYDGRVRMESSTSVDPGSAPRMKDPKSFTQNLFDTLSLRMVEWLPLRRSPEAFDKQPYNSVPSAARSPKSGSRRSETYSRTESSSDQERPFVADGATGNNPRTPSSRGPGHPAAVELKLPNQHVKRLSLTEIDQWRQSPRSSLEEKSLPDRKPARKPSLNAHATTDEFVSMPSPPALKHRHQKHRGRASGINSGQPKDQQKKQRRVSWDGTKLSNDARSSNDPVIPPIPQDQFPIVQPPSEGKPRNKSQRHMEDAVSPVETVTHLSNDIVDGLGQMMVQSEEDARNWKEELALMELSGSFDDSELRFATPRQRQVFNFVAQTVFYALGSTRQALRSFRKGSAPDGVKQNALNASNTHLDVQQLQPSFRRLFTICPWDIALQSLWIVLEKAFIPPKELSTPGRPSRRTWGSSMAAPLSAPTVLRRASDTASDEHISDTSAADIATVAFFALVSYLPRMDAPTWRSLVRMRAVGAVASDADMRKLPSASTGMIVEATDKLEHELALRLVSRLVRALTARLAFHRISKACEVYSHDSPKQRKDSVLDFVIDNLSEHYDMIASEVDDHGHSRPSTQPPSASAFIVEWIRTLFLKEWDGKAQVSRSSAAGGAIQILNSMYKERHRIGVAPEDFYTAFLAERLDPLEMPVEWLSSLSNNKTMHLLSYSFLFPPSALVIYFRALNYSAMSKYYEDAMTTTRHITQTAFGAIQIHDDVDLLARMKTSMSTYLVLVVRRDNVLTDALDQIWRREKRELMRPLKVQMGMDEGEEGLDHGGVQQEFFRVLLAVVLDPSYGMFTLDLQTRTSWFQPCSWEPLYKFELLGILVSLAIYNGLTLPINFPVAFYRKLLGLKVKHLDHIRDGWPELAKGFDDLLGWSDGDVGDVFMRTYEFSFEAFGNVEAVDMQRVDRDAMWPLPPKTLPPDTAAHGPFATWSEVPRYSDRANLSPPSSMAAEATEPASSESVHGDAAKPVDEPVPIQSPTPPSDEPSLVTNLNRHEFVKDYIFWLTDKSIRPQFEAFVRGFHTCLDRTALSIFTPEALKTVVEGIQEIDLKELERHARYEGGFTPSHRVIRDFWSVVQSYSAEKKAQLLEFVTASDRVPVNGIESILFVVQKNGVGDTRLPTSLTCFGRLLLPEYSSREVLEEKLDKALENAQGFGVA